MIKNETLRIVAFLLVSSLLTGCNSKKEGEPSTESKEKETTAKEIVVVKTPIIEKPIINKPIINKPIINKPIINKPIINKPITNEAGFLFSEGSVKADDQNVHGGLYKDAKVLTLSDNHFAVFYGALKDRKIKVMPFTYSEKDHFKVDITKEITVKIARESTDNGETVYWAPSMLLEKGVKSTLYLYYTKGNQTDIASADSIQWDSFRSYVSKMTFPNGSDILKMLRDGTFKDTRMISLNPIFMDQTDFALIDFNVYYEKGLKGLIPSNNGAGGNYLSYYTLILPGKPGRSHEQFIRMKKMDEADHPWGYRGPKDSWQWEETGLYDGFAKAEADDGVAEASRVYKLADQQYLLTLSVRPSDNDQYIKGCIDSNPSFNNKVTTNPFDNGQAGNADTADCFTLLAGNTATWAYKGVGHSDLFQIKEQDGISKHYLFYQGLGNNGFSFGVQDVTETIIDHQ